MVRGRVVQAFIVRRSGSQVVSGGRRKVVCGHAVVLPDRLERFVSVFCHRRSVNLAACDFFCRHGDSFK
jgi:hypothetical protein